MKADIRHRLDEIHFIRFIDRILQVSNNPGKVYDLVELLCNMTGVSFLYLQQPIARILQNDPKIFPSKYEMYQLLSQTEKPVIQICRELHISMRQYYGKDTPFQEKLNKKPRFTKEQTEAISKFLDALDDVFIERRDYTNESVVY